jgi:hypothetical protein
VKAQSGSITFESELSSWVGQPAEWKSSMKIKAEPAAHRPTVPDFSGWCQK